MGVSPEAKEALSTLRDLRFAQTPALRVRALRDVGKFVRGHADEPAAVYKAVLQMVTPTARRYHDRASRLAALQLVDACLQVQQDATLSTFAALLATTASDLNGYPSTALGTSSTVVDWALVAVGHAASALPESSRDEWTALAKVLSMALVCVATDKGRFAARATRACQQTLRKNAQAVTKLMAVLKRGPVSAVYMGLCSQLALLVGTEGAPETLGNDLGPVILNIILKHVVATAQVVPHAAVLDAGVPALQHLGHAEFKDKLLPALVMSTKKNLAGSLPVITWALGSTKLDLSAYAADITNLIADVIKNKDATIRGHGLNATVLFALRCSDSSAAEVAVTRLLELLTNKAEKVTQSDCRAAVYAALGALATAPIPAVSRHDVAFSTIVKILTQCQKESVEGTYVAGLVAISCLADVCGTKAHCPELVAAVTKALEDPKLAPAITTAYLQCLLASFQGEHAATAAGMCPPVLKAMRAAKSGTTASVRYLAATFLLRVARADPGAPAGTTEPKFATLIAQDRPIAERFFGKHADSAPQLELLTLCLSNVAVVGKNAERADILCDMVLTLLTHDEWSVRRATRDALRAFLQQRQRAPPLAVRLALIDAFERALATRTPAAAGTDTDTTNTVASSTVPPSGAALREGCILSEAYYALAVIDGPDQNVLAARLLIPGHHRLLVRSNCWSKAIASMVPADQGAGAGGGGADEDVEAPSMWCVDDAVDELVQAVCSGMTSDIDSTCRAVRTLAHRHDATAVVDGIANHVLLALRNPALSSVTQHDVDILDTPEGTLASEHTRGDDELAALNPNSKDYEEQVWEIKVRRELARKKGLDKPTKKLTKAEIDKRKAKLEEEANVRQRVTALRDASVAALRLAVQLAQARGTFAALRIACVTPLLFAHAQSPLLAKHAHRALLDVGASVDVRLRPLADAVAHTVLRASEASAAVPPGWLSVGLGELTARTMRRLWAVTNAGEPLDVPSFGFCWPLLQYILARSSLPGAVMEDALVFLTAHPDLGASPLAPRKGVLKLLAHVATNHERLTFQATTYLRVLVDSMLTGEVDAQDGGEEGDDGEAMGAVGPAELSILIESAQSSSVDLRRAAIECLHAIGRVQPSPEVIASVWLARHDVEDGIAQASVAYWDEQGLTLPDTLLDSLVQPLRSTDQHVRQAGANAIAAAIEVDESLREPALTMLLQAFEAALIVPEVELDHLGNAIGPEPIDEWFFRCGIAQTWKATAKLMPPESIERLFTFLVEVALVQDRDGRSQEALMSAGAELVDQIATAGSCDSVLQIVNAALEAQRHHGTDSVRVSLVVLLGSIAKHLDPTDPQIPEVIELLLAALNTPSQTVQEAVGNCISPLIKAVKPRATAILERLFDQLLEDPKFGVRRGAAYGIAGVVKGLGILALKQNGVTDKLKSAIEDKKNARHREGALMAYELLCVRLGRLFEPYIINVLRDLLVCYGDNNKDVREAADETAQAIMSKLSSHGVKLVLPLLLEGIENSAWRTKLGSVELLGAMAFMAPKQLSACLPTIVPRIQQVLSDAHTKVQTAGRDALKKIGSVIKNPEIQTIVPAILNALDDPDKHSEECLRVLLETAFIHVIDAPSLALIMPILQRALNDRSTKLKKSAAQIIGNMYTLTEPKDLAPYLPALLPGVQEALLDPEPSVRGIASKALGSIVKGMGEDSFPELMPWLFETLRSETNSVDRSGAAQGLSEVLLALGLDRLDSMLEDFIAGTQHPLSHVREGHLMLFVYLPVSFKEDFVGFVGRIIPCLLRGLSDMEDGVRSTAMRAAVGIITHFSATSVELLLPELERGLVDESWRIRESSVRLLGELMFMVSGITGKQTTVGDEDESFGTEESEKFIIEALGRDRRNRVLAGIFLARQDASYQVRTAAAHVWKVVVPHTVRTLREVLPALIALLLSSLGDDTGERRITAAKTLSEVLRKLGERILPQIFPILERNAQADEPATRHGVCVALSEVIKTCSVEQLEPYMPVLIGTVKSSLIDTEEDVRAAASQVFAALHTLIGPHVVEEIVSPLLAEVKDNPNALDGLRQMIGSKGSFILPLVVPQLLAPPFTASNASVLASLSVVAGPALTKHLEAIVAAFIQAIEDEQDEVEVGTIRESLSALVLSLEEDGIDFLLPQLLDTLTTGAVSARRTAAELVADVCRSLDGAVDFEEHYEDIISALLLAFKDAEAMVVHGAWGALNALLTERIKANKPKYMRHTVSALEEVTADGEVAGFSIPNGVKPIMSLLVPEGLHELDVHTKLTAMKGLGFVVKGCDEEALKKARLTITGSIIRVASESDGALKAECLRVANELLRKIPTALKTMLPQLQPTFLKSLRDPTAQVRTNAVQALGKIAPLQRRMDPAFNDLLSGLDGAGTAAQRVVFLKALAAVSVGGGGAATPEVRSKAMAQLKAALQDDDEDVREMAGTAVGCLARHIAPEDVVALVQECVGGSGDWTEQHGHACAVRDLLCYADVSAVPIGDVAADASRLLKSDNVTLQGAGAGIAAAIMAVPETAAASGALEKQLASAAEAPTTTKDWHRCVAQAFSAVVMRRDELPDDFISFAVGLLYLSTKKRSGLVEVEYAIGRLLHMGAGDEGRARYIAGLPEAEATAFENFCEKKVARHEEALRETLW
eukprot:m.27053 g.27053  ORF g.27053 m.27053 type:complete len:2638 (-) comp4371_c0_seq1:195-8108(-)